MDVAQKHIVSDMMKKIRAVVTCTVTSGGRVLGRGDELRRCGVHDGSTVQVMNRMRIGRRRKDKKSEAEKRERSRDRSQ